MENDIRSGGSISDNDTESSKMTCTSIEGSTASGFATKDSYSSRSSTREFPAKKWNLATPSSTGNTRQLEKHMHTLGKKKLKRTEKRRISIFFKKSEKNDQRLFSCFSVSNNPEKVSSSSKIERRKVKSEKSTKQHKLDTSKCGRNKEQDQEPQRSTSKRTRLDARSYRHWLGSRARKDKALDLLQGTRSLLSRGGNASEEVEDGVVESCFSSPKRQRVEFDTKQQCCSRNAELGDDLHGTSVPKVVFEQASVARSPPKDEIASVARSPPKDEIAVSDIKDEICAAKEDDGRQSMPRLRMGLTEEYADDANGKGSQLEAETNAQHNACVVCMLGGQLLFCVGKGCKYCYHLSCLDPPLNNNPPGVWHCICCVKKKIELGVHSVSQEVDSIWDAREVDSDSKVMQSEKQYLVKYRGLAHVHNRWISEIELRLEAPKLVAKFNKKNQVIRWKAEWTVPHRLLLKRKISFPKHHDGYHSDGDGGNTLNGHYEWLVKWTGLGYDHSTWELESASFLKSPEAIKLMKDYECRHEKTEKLSRISEADKEGKGNFSELSELSFGDSPGVYNRYLSYVNKLRKYWHKGQNAVVVDQADQERVVKVILFILSLQFVVRKPFLIISTSTALSAWEDEFLHIAPSSNVVVYKGKKDVRSSIRSLEFYNEGGNIMFQVLLSSSDAVLEDLEVLECIGWEAIIIDECQRSSMSRHLRKIKMLCANMSLLLFSSQIKDCLADYHSLLSFLDSGHDGQNGDNTEVEADTDIDKLKKQFARYIAFECKSGSSRFIEYWVPVQLSDLQLEQYCATLLSNSMLLCSCLKNDQADDALREIIFSTRKCCDHPYLLDQSLQSIVTKGLPIEENLDVGIKVSGKLQLLDKILLEMKSRGLRVLILFQSIGDSGRDSVGNILDDFVCQRFGKDSYVRFDGRYARSQKLAALNMFNDKASGRFVFLIEDRACLPSIKLQSVDTVILFDSDYDPQNDLKSLHRITIGSQFEQLKVFRLYSSCTIEEKVLILAKEGVTLDGNIRSLNRNTCHTLLNWGASYVFHKLDDFHGCKKSASGSNTSEQSFLNDVFHELLTQLPSSGNNDTRNCSIISQVQQNGVYARNILLLGEKEMDLIDNEPPPFFWKNLLKGRHPQWKFLSESSPRGRRKVQYIDKSEFEFDAVIKKSRKVMNNTVAPVYRKSRLKDKRKLVLVDKDDKLADSNGDLNQSTQFSLKPEISQLCEILQLPKNVKATAVSFLEYIIKDYNVSWEEESTRQAFQISLCWTAADLLSYEINYKESFALAKQQLNFGCKEEEVDFIYARLQNAKKVFSRCSENVEGVKDSNNAKTSNFSVQQDLEGGEMTMGFQSHNFSDQGPSTTEQSPGSRREEKNDISSSIRKVQEICGKRMRKLLSKQQKENHKFNRKMREERAKLEETLRLEYALIHTRESDISVRLDKLKILDHNFKEKMDEHNHQMAIHRKNLEASQLASRIEEEQLKANWSVQLEKSKSGSRVSSLGNLCSPDNEFKVDDMQPNITAGVDIDPSQLEKSKSGTPVLSLGNLCSSVNEFKVDKLQPSNTTGTVAGPQNAVPNAIPSSPKQTETETVQSVPSEVPDISLNAKTFCSFPMGTIPIPTESDREVDGMEAIISERATATCGEQHNKAGSTSDGVEDGGPVSGPSERQSPVKNEQTIQSVVQPSEVLQTVPNEVIMRNDAMQPNKESGGIDAVSLEKATVSKVGQHNRAATPICGESPTLEVPGTKSSMVQPGINNIQEDSFLSQQLPISINPSSTGHNLPATAVFMGIQNHQSSLRHAPSQEAQVPTQPLIEVPVELFGHSVEHPITHLPPQPSTSMPVDGIETHVQDLPSTPTLLGMDDHILQANPVTPEMHQHARSDPLQNEMERIHRAKEQAFKMHEDKMLQLKYEYNKEIEEIRMKYEMLLQDAEAALLQKKEDLDTCYKKVYVNKLLAEALTLKQDNYKAAWSSESVSGFLCQLNLQTTQMSGPRREQFLASTTAASPLDVVSHLSAISSTSPGPPGRPLSSPIIHSQGNLQHGNVVRAPAPHLQASRPSAFMLTPHVPTMCSGMPNELGNLPTPVMQTQLAPRLNSESYNICLPESGGFPVFHSSLSDHPGTNLQGQLPLHDFSSCSTPSQSGQAVTSISGFPNVSSSAATDVVYVSDDDWSNTDERYLVCNMLTRNLG